MTLKTLYDRSPEWSYETELTIVFEYEGHFEEQTCFHDCFIEDLYSDAEVLAVDFEHMIFSIGGF